MYGTSKFPYSIDDRICFSDTSLDTLETYNWYIQYVNKGEYDKAQKLTEKISVYNADLLNHLESRLVRLGSFVKQLKKQPLVFHGENEPGYIVHWVGDKLDSPYNIFTIDVDGEMLMGGMGVVTLPDNVELYETVEDNGWYVSKEGKLIFTKLDPIICNYSDKEPTPWDSKKHLIKSIEWPTNSSPEHLGDYLFDGLINLQEIIIPDTVSSVGNYCFRDCSSLLSVNIPSTVVRLGIGMFKGCTNLRHMEFPGHIKELPRAICMDCTNIRIVEFPESLEVIGKDAFNNCKSLMIAILTACKNMKTIHGSAFKNCENLMSLYTLDNLENYGEYAFDGCVNLSYRIPNSARNIGVNAFKNVKHIYYTYEINTDGAPWGAKGVN